MVSAALLLKKIRTLTIGLAISGAINIVLVATLVTVTVMSGRRALPTRREAVSHSAANHEILKNYFTLSFKELLLELQRPELLEDGYAYCDLALACLVSFHDFDMGRALPKTKLQKRKISFSNEEGSEMIELTIFAGLKKEHFEKICTFAFNELWPLTPRGLFNEMRQSSVLPPTLKEAFVHSEEFHILKTLFERSDAPLSDESLLALLLSGSWETVNAFAEKHRHFADLTPTARRDLLFTYLENGSSKAAHLLIETDLAYALHHLNDQELTRVLRALKDPTDQSETFVKKLLTGLRCDEVRQRAGQKLYDFAGESPPEPYQHELALARFVPDEKESAPPLKALFVKESPAHERYHRVVDGDTLWKLSRMYGASVSAIKEANDLENAYRLPIGRLLIIP